MSDLSEEHVGQDVACIKGPQLGWRGVLFAVDRNRGKVLVTTICGSIIEDDRSHWIVWSDMANAVEISMLSPVLSACREARR